MNAPRTFEDDLDRFGGTLARWPAGARREAEALLAGSSDARALHAAMVRMEYALALPALDDAAASRRFASIATCSPQQRLSLLRRAPPILARAACGAAVAAALVLGVLVGDVTRGARDDGPDQVLASALGPAVGAVDVD